MLAQNISKDRKHSPLGLIITYNIELVPEHWNIETINQMVAAIHMLASSLEHNHNM